MDATKAAAETIARLTSDLAAARAERDEAKDVLVAVESRLRKERDEARAVIDWFNLGELRKERDDARAELATVKADRDETERVAAACMTALQGFFNGVTDSCCIDLEHDDECPEDDTCECTVGDITRVASKAHAEALSLTRRISLRASRTKEPHD